MPKNEIKFKDSETTVFEIWGWVWVCQTEGDVMYQKCRIEIVDAGEEDGGKNGGCGQLVSARTSRIEGKMSPDLCGCVRLGEIYS